MDLKKVSEAEWELAKEGSMNVPVRIVAEEPLLQKMKLDRTLSQARNVASLPGIIRASFVMPDGHEGYGFPIGGVAAFDLDEGVVSPGGVGYDINCLPSGTKILTEFGFFKRIEDFEKEFSGNVNAGAYSLSVFSPSTRILTVSSSKKQVEARQMLAFMKRRTDRVLEITTAAGLRLSCTPDHPLFVSGAMKNSGLVSKGEWMGVSFFEGVEFEERIPLVFNGIVEAGILTKLAGYFFGDGTICWCGKKLRATAFGKATDLKRMQDELKRLGIHSKLLERKRNHRIVTQYGEKTFESNTAELHIYQKTFIERLLELGVPLGKKANSDFSVPAWVFGSPLWMKRLFLAGLFGAELSSPQTHTKTGFYSPILSQNKNEKFKESGRKFLIQLMQLLDEFGVRVTKIAERREHPNKEGDVWRLRLEISAEEENLLRLWRKIGFEYSEDRRKRAEIAVKYVLLKKKLTQKRIEIASQVKELRKKGLTLKEAIALLECAYANKRFIERHYYGSGGQRITLDFPSFRDFKEKALREFAEYGVLLDEVEEVKQKPYDGDVYDFTVEENHNFLANGFLVSNCGVRLVRTDLSAQEVLPKIKELTNALYDAIPSGVGSKGRIRLDARELDKAVTEGTAWAKAKGYAVEEDLQKCEENGSAQEADPSKVSSTAKQRGAQQIGTLGSGNHFIELQRVEKVFDENIAEAFGLHAGQLTVMIHSGSRGFGHQICDDYIRVMLGASQKYKINLPDRELCAAPFSSKEAQDYLGAMRSAMNYAFLNRQLMEHWTRECFSDFFKRSWDSLGMHTVYDVCHNIAKVEEHEVDGKNMKVVVHRKGATRAFWAGRSELPAAYRGVGQPVLIPGSMGTASYVLCGLPSSANYFGSTCHGAGRVMSRHEAIRTYGSGQELLKQLAGKGIYIRSTGKEIVSEEAPGAYKDVDAVVHSTEVAGISKIVARLVPLGVVKG
jgi:tRNA-splicing ligase RtcB